MVTSSTLAVTACGGTNTTHSFYETDYNNAFSAVFSSKEKKNFSMLPNLKPKELEVEKANSTNLDILNFKNKEFKIDCTNYECNSVNEFKGKKISKEEYNGFENDQKIAIQYALDDLASWFVIEPNEFEDSFYDYSNLELHSNNWDSTYYFDKYKLEDELVLWSKQSTLYIKNNDKRVDSNFLFFDKTIKLSSDFIQKTLKAKEVTVSNDGLKIIFNVKNNDEFDEKLNTVKDIFWNYQSNINFEKDETENSWTTNNLNKFKLDSYSVEKIKVDFILSGGQE